jgi:muramidase (phage lysozyme)
MSWVYTAAAAAIAWLILSARRQGDQLPPTSAAVWYPSWPSPDDAWLPSADPQADNMPDQLPTITEAAIVTVSEAASSIPEALGFSAAPPPPSEAETNLRAFLDAIAYAEGTGGPNGYRTLFGGGLFDSFADHPRQFFTFTNKIGQQLRTSAAGRYQFLSRTWDELAKKLELPDFGPESQDRAAIELIRQRGALRDVQAGRFADAVAKVAPIWASLPGAGYNQPERKLSALTAAYRAAGGTLET